jgi:predicted transcriptional regulator
MSDVRRRIEAHVRANPGVHFNELGRELDVATGQVQYHLRRLTDAGAVAPEAVRDRTHYFPSDYDPWERRALALLRRETVREIIVAALGDGDAAAADLTEDLGVARSTISWHLDTLEEAGIAETAYDDKGRVRVTLTRPEETRELLDEVRPSWPDRLVDRYTRLVDASLGD